MKQFFVNLMLYFASSDDLIVKLSFEDKEQKKESFLYNMGMFFLGLFMYLMVLGIIVSIGCMFVSFK